MTPAIIGPCEPLQRSDHSSLVIGLTFAAFPLVLDLVEGSRHSQSIPYRTTASPPLSMSHSTVASSVSSRGSWSMNTNISSLNASAVRLSDYVTSSAALLMNHPRSTSRTSATL